MSQETTAAFTISRVESRLEQLQNDALLNAQRDRLGEAEALLGRLPQQVAQLRSQGYVYKTHLEEQLAQLARRWPPVRVQAGRAIEAQAATLRSEIVRADQAVRRLQPMKTRPLSTVQPTIQRVEDELTAVERRIRAAQQAAEAVFEPLVDEVQAVAREVQGCERLMQWLAGATFTVESGESLVDAAEARWIDGKDQTEGILFLTDQRVLFERREKVALKKVLFVTTSSEIVKELRWQAALADLERIEASEARKALVSKRELLTLAPRGGGRATSATLELRADSDTWRAQILRCQSGGMASERAEGAVEQPEYLVPAKCASCGGALSRAGRVRGISTVCCDYCGTTIALEKA
ncbi:MAG: hypothetical protein ACYC4R_16370 [Anaerolineae bacterium]